MYQNDSEGPTNLLTTVDVVSTLATNSTPPSTDNSTVTLPLPIGDGYRRFPFPTLFIVFVWALLVAFYLVARWRQKEKNIYIIPRVFVLCSPRTVQFHYELILRVGLPANDFNPEKHDVDITVMGTNKNEVVPTTRLNTRTLLDEPLITNLSIVVYRLVEMPQLGALCLKHSGPYKSWIYAYDFTVIDLTTNKEWYYTLNQYIGSLERTLVLDAPNSNTTVHYPIDDVPLPAWTLEDIVLLLYTVVNYIMLTVTLMPINCTYLTDLVVVLLTAILGGMILLFLDWLFYYCLRWKQDRREFFNDYTGCSLILNELTIRIIIGLVGTALGAACIYYTLGIGQFMDSIVWVLIVSNCCILVIGVWNVARQLDFGDSIVALGLRMRGIETLPVGMRFSEMVPDIRTKSGSTSDDGRSAMSTLRGSSSKLPRSSAKSFGFDPVTGNKNLSKVASSKNLAYSSTGATPNTQTNPRIIKPSAQKAQKMEESQSESSKKSTSQKTPRPVPLKTMVSLKEDSMDNARSKASSESGSIGKNKKEKSESSRKSSK